MFCEYIKNYYKNLKHLQGCYSFFPNFFQVFQISSRFLKVHIFGSIFSFKLISIKETVLNRIKALKRYCKVTLSVSFNKKNV